MAAIITRQIFSNRSLLSAVPSLTCLCTRLKTSNQSETHSKKSMVKEFLEDLKEETLLFKEEFKEKCLMDPMLNLNHKDYEYFWKMNCAESVEQWAATSDMDNNQGRSTASLVFSKNNTAIFSGYLSQEVPKDGVQKKSGYANIRAPSNFKSFKKRIPYNWSAFNCIVMRVRGDGRPYMINILMDNHYSMTWNDQYNYGLYTRGGPYWQIAKIPFSKFYLSHGGRIQDKQSPIPLERIQTLGLSIGDGQEGPFSLEIDYIALMYDANHYETFAYEMYRPPGR